MLSSGLHDISNTRCGSQWLLSIYTKTQIILIYDVNTRSFSFCEIQLSFYLQSAQARDRVLY